MTKSEIFKAAHAFARASVCKIGDYMVAFQYSLKVVYKKLKLGASFVQLEMAAKEVSKKYEAEIIKQEGFFTNNRVFTTMKGTKCKVYKFASKEDYMRIADKSFGMPFDCDGVITAYKY